MKLKNFLTLSALATIISFGNTHAANSINQNGSLLVTLDANNSATFVTTFPNRFSFIVSNGPLACEDGTYTQVETYWPDGTSLIEGFCDVIHIRAAGLSGTNTLALGAVQARGLTIPGTLDIRGGGDDDTVAFGSNVSVGKAILTLRGGNNRVRGAANSFSPMSIGPFNFTAVTSGSFSVNTTLDIDTNNGDDIVNFRALTVGGTADINVGGGDDKANIFGGGGTNSFNKVFLRLGNGDNEGSIRNTICHLCQVFGGGGSDDIFLGRVTAGIDVDVIAGGGDDTVELNNVTSGTDVNANGGAGDDCLIDNGNSATTVSNFEGCAL